MLTHTQRTYIETASMFLAIAVTFTLWTPPAAAVDCIGKVYGYPGCPKRPESSSGSSVSSSGYCGNAIVEAGEQCDRGRFNGKNDCSLACKVLYCGDGVVTSDLGEDCDPAKEEYYVQDVNGNLTTEIRFADAPVCGWYCQVPVCSDDGACSGGCKLTFLGACREDNAPTSAFSSASVSELPVAEYSSASSVFASSYVSSSSLPTVAVCGDGTVDDGEQCDNGKDNSDTASGACRTNCTTARCGDGTVDDGEQCDAGAQNSDAQPNACRTSCNAPYCGDGVLDKGEECDDGNISNSDKCANFCKLPTCGDGIVQQREECDNGQSNSDAAPGACRTNCMSARCGDMVVDEGEQCDGGKLCDEDCHAQPPPAATVSTSSAAQKSRPSRTRAVSVVRTPQTRSSLVNVALPAALGAAGVMIVVSVFLFRKRIISLFFRTIGTDG